MKVLVLAAKLVEMPDDLRGTSEISDFTDFEAALRIGKEDTQPFTVITTAFPTDKGFFTYNVLRFASYGIMNWVRKVIQQPLPVPSHPRQMWLTDEERDAYDESLR